MSVSLLEMLENLAYNTRLGDEADYPELASASVTKERVDFVGDRFKLHLLQRVWNVSGPLGVDVASF